MTSGGQFGGGGVSQAGSPDARGVHWAADQAAARTSPTYHDRLNEVRARLPPRGSPWPIKQVIWPQSFSLTATFLLLFSVLI